MNEDDVRVLLLDRADHIEVGPPPVAAARSQAQRLRRRPLLVALGSVAAGAAVAAVIITAAVTGRSVSPPAPATNTLDGNVPTVSDLLGTWYATTLQGQPVPDGMTTVERKVRFRIHDRQLGWRSVDMCNIAAASSDLGSDGAFTVDGLNQTAVGCVATAWPSDVSVPAVLAAATDVRLDGESLTFYDSSGQPIGTFIRAPSLDGG